MNNRSASKIAQRKPLRIQTTIMELIETISSLTQDDALVVATMKNIFADYQVRRARTLAPDRLVHGDVSAQGARRHLSKKSLAWV